jgi:hypothetical protein
MDNNISCADAEPYVILIRGTHVKFGLVVRLSGAALCLHKVSASWRKLAQGLSLARVDSSVKARGLRRVGKSSGPEMSCLHKVSASWR